jgi:hypothetical protein
MDESVVRPVYNVPASIWRLTKPQNLAGSLRIPDIGYGTGGVKLADEHRLAPSSGARAFGTFTIVLRVVLALVTVLVSARTLFGVYAPFGLGAATILITAGAILRWRGWPNRPQGWRRAGGWAIGAVLALGAVAAASNAFLAYLGTDDGDCGNYQPCVALTRADVSLLANVDLPHSSLIRNSNYMDPDGYRQLEVQASVPASIDQALTSDGFVLISRAAKGGLATPHPQWSLASKRLAGIRYFVYKPAQGEGGYPIYVLEGTEPDGSTTIVVDEHGPY